MTDVEKLSQKLELKAEVYAENYTAATKRTKEKIKQESVEWQAATALRELAAERVKLQLHIAQLTDEGDDKTDEIVDLEAERDEAIRILAHTDIGSLPNDWTLRLTSN